MFIISRQARGAVMNVPPSDPASSSRRSEAQETLVLDDGREVVVAPVTPAARPLIERGIEHVSAESTASRTASSTR